MSRSPITTRMRSSPSEMPQAGTSSPEEHADQVVVAAAAAEAAGEVGHRNLEDGAGVVRQPARERLGSMPQVRAGAGRAARARRSARSSASASAPSPRQQALEARSTSRLNAVGSASAVAAPRRTAAKNSSSMPAPASRHAARLAVPPPRRRGRSCRACRARRARRCAAPPARRRRRASPRSTPAVIEADREVREAEAREHVAGGAAAARPRPPSTSSRWRPRRTGRTRGSGPSAAGRRATPAAPGSA